jgi:hypothetical protein
MQEEAQAEEGNELDALDEEANLPIEELLARWVLLCAGRGVLCVVFVEKNCVICVKQKNVCDV